MEQKTCGDLNLIYSAEIQLQNSLLTWIQESINVLPFWLPQNSYTKIKQIAAAKQPSLELAIEQRKSLNQWVLMSLENMMKQLKDRDSALAKSCLKFSNLLKNIEKNIDLGYLAKNNLLAIFQDSEFEIKKQTKIFFDQIRTIKDKSLKALSLYTMKQEQFIEKYQLRLSDFRRAKYVQHRIKAGELLLQKPDQIIHFNKPKPLLVIDWLEKNDYADLLFLLSIISPEYLEEGLEQKEFLLQEILKNLHEQARELKVSWQDQTSAIIRLYRIQRFYQHWQITLSQAFDKLDSRPKEQWTTLSTFMHLFTYEKKTFFTEALKNENANRLFSELTNLVANKPEFKDPQAILSNLNQEIQALKTQLNKDKDRILNQYPLWKKITSFFGLALTEQASYKKGIIGFDLGSESIDQIAKPQSEKIDAWNSIVPTWVQEKLNLERDKKIIRHLTGLVCFIADQGISSWMGYGYRAITAINQIFFSQFDTLVNLGAKIGLDEIALLEKEKTMQGLSGLGIHLLLQSPENWLPAFFSYLTATTASLASTILIDDLIKNDLVRNSKALAIGKFVIQVGIYSKVYSLSFKKSAEFLQPTKGMTPAKALNVMGFYSQPSKRDLQKRFHSLARENQSDKCLSLCPSNEEEAILQSCIEACKTKDQTMRDINEAYSYLKTYLAK